MHPELFTFDLAGSGGAGWVVDTYSALIITGFVLAMVLARRQMRREQEEPGHIIQIAFWVMFSGWVGGRLGFVLTGLAQGTGRISDLWSFGGGMVWYSGFILASITFYFYCRYSRINFFKVADICIPYLAYAHAYGRLGCLAAGCCFGRPASGLLALQFPRGSPVHAAHVAEGLTTAVLPPLPVHATQLYEAAAEILLFAGLSWLRPRKRNHGQVFAAWVLGYALLRFFNEMLRGDSARGVWAAGLSTSQWISLAALPVAAALFWHAARRAES